MIFFFFSFLQSTWLKQHWYCSIVGLKLSIENQSKSLYCSLSRISQIFIWAMHEWLQFLKKNKSLISILRALYQINYKETLFNKYDFLVIYFTCVSSAQGCTDVKPHYRITKTCLFKHIENFTTKNWKFSDKNSDIFHISAQNRDCGYSLESPCRGGSNEYSQSMFLSRNKKNNVYPCKPQFYYIKWGLRGSNLYRYVFVMGIFDVCTWASTQFSRRITSYIST